MTGQERSCLLTTCVVLALVLRGGECFQWTDSLQDSASVAACVHGNLSLPWTFTLDFGETVQDIKWNFRSQHGQQELVATYISGTFLASPSFSQRVQYLANGGLLLDHVTKADSGNYSVDVAVHNSSDTVLHFRKTTAVHVEDGLQVSEEPRAVYDPETDSWHVMLACGIVVSPDDSLDDILWQTPSGVLPSTKYEDGHFYLQLQNPVKGGDYSCTLAQNSTASVCRPLSSQQEPKITVDETKTRVRLLEAENGHLKAKVNHTEQRLVSTEQRLNSTESELAQTQSRFTQLEDRLALLEKPASNQVSFYARMSGLQESYNCIGAVPVILSRVHSNVGEAYNETTGEFTAPANGTYFFAATAAFSVGYSASFYVMLNTDDVCYVLAYSPDSNDASSTCALTLQLTSGDTVWLKNHLVSRFHFETTTFTGFLIQSDE